jgi:hypothetical protein
MHLLHWIVRKTRQIMKKPGMIVIISKNRKQFSSRKSVSFWSMNKYMIEFQSFFTSNITKIILAKKKLNNALTEYIVLNKIVFWWTHNIIQVNKWINVLFGVRNYELTLFWWTYFKGNFSFKDLDKAIFPSEDQ